MTKKQLQKIETSLTTKLEQLSELNKEIDILSQYYLTAKVPSYGEIGRIKHCPNCSKWYLNERGLVRHILDCDKKLDTIMEELDGSL